MKIRLIATGFLVPWLVLVAACAPQMTNEELQASIVASVHESWRKRVAAGTEGYMDTVYERISLGQLDIAIADCEEIREIRPGDYPAYIAEGFAYRRKGEHSIAINRFSSAISIDDTSAVPYYFRARSYTDIGRHEEALNDINKTIASRDFSAQLVNYYRKIDGETNKDLSEETMSGIVFQEQALAYHRLGQTSLAIASADKAIRAIPTDSNLYFTRGVLYGNQHKYTAATKDFEKALELDPDSAATWNFAGRTNIVLGDYNKAAIYLQKATDLDPERIDFLTNYGLAQWLQGDQAKAFEAMGKALRGEPNDTTYYHLAYFNHLNGHQEKALEYYQKAHGLNNDLLKARASIASSTPASSPTRKFYEDELANATIYIERGKTPDAIAHESREPRFEVTGITFDPDPVPLNKSFDFNVRFDVDVPSSTDQNIPTSLSFKILRGSKTLLTSESYTINAENGSSKKWALHMNPVRTKGTYTIRVTIKHKNLINERSIELRID